MVHLTREGGIEGGVDPQVISVMFDASPDPSLGSRRWEDGIAFPKEVEVVVIPNPRHNDPVEQPPTA